MFVILMNGGVNNFCVFGPVPADEYRLHADEGANGDTGKVEGFLIVALYEDVGERIVIHNSY